MSDSKLRDNEAYVLRTLVSLFRVYVEEKHPDWTTDDTRRAGPLSFLTWIMSDEVKLSLPTLLTLIGNKCGVPEEFRHALLQQILEYPAHFGYQLSLFWSGVCGYSDEPLQPECKALRMLVSLSGEHEDRNLQVVVEDPVSLRTMGLLSTMVEGSARLLAGLLRQRGADWLREPRIDPAGPAAG